LCRVEELPSVHINIKPNSNFDFVSYFINLQIITKNQATNNFHASMQFSP
jgi:hypothetical protein